MALARKARAARSGAVGAHAELRQRRPRRVSGVIAVCLVAGLSLPVGDALAQEPESAVGDCGLEAPGSEPFKGPVAAKPFEPLWVAPSEPPHVQRVAGSSWLHSGT